MSGEAKPLNALTGLRWVAAFAVFIHHVQGRIGIEKPSWWLGSLAVSFFFVLSGFILTYVYSERLKPGKVTVGKFLFTRWARIWPLHIVCMLIHISLFIKWGDLFDSSSKSTLFLTNFSLLQSWVPDSSWVFSFNGVSWSISTELFFYAMFPLLLLGGQKQFWYKYAGVCILALGALLALGQMETWAALQTWQFNRIGHVNPFLRLPEFCTGMAVGYLYLNGWGEKAKRNIVWDTILEVGCFGLIIGWVFAVQKFGVLQYFQKSPIFGQSFVEWFRVSSCVWVFALMIYVYSRSRGLVARLMSCRLMVFLGEISFAFYMIHFVVILYVKNWIWPNSSLHPYVLATCMFFVSLALSIALYKIVEMPAKISLLSLYERKFWKFLTAIPKQVSAFGKTGLSWLALLFLIVPAHIMDKNQHHFQPTKLDSEIIMQSANFHRNVEFDGKIELLGSRTVVKHNGIELQMVWKKRTDLIRNRFVHVVDKDSKIIGFGKRNDSLFENAEFGKPFVDKVFLSDQTIKDAKYIGVGFHGPKIGMLTVKKGPRTIRNSRLSIVTDVQFNRIMGHKAERFGKKTGGKQSVTR